MKYTDSNSSHKIRTKNSMSQQRHHAIMPAKKRRVMKPLPVITPSIPDTSLSPAELEKNRNLAPESVTSNLFCGVEFTSLGLSDALVKQLKNRVGIDKPTSIQKLSIPLLRDGHDLLARSPTGSGKTLAFLLPIVERLIQHTPKITRNLGTIALVLVPTRELAMQISSVLDRVLTCFHWIVSGTLIGGDKKKSEKARLRKGVSVVVATPGRLLDHLQTTECFNITNLTCFVLDEADRLMDLGFEDDIMAITDALNSRRQQSLSFQCAMFSATLSNKLTKLSEYILKNPKRVEASHSTPSSSPNAHHHHHHHPETFDMPTTLSQGFVQVPQRLRFIALASFLRWKVASCQQGDLKAMVFVSTCDEVDFISMMFAKAFWPPRQSHYTTKSSNDDNNDDEDFNDDDDEENVSAFVDLPLFRLHGNLAQCERCAVYKRFCRARGGLLICTDVAARGLDLPAVDWIVQYDAPTDVSEYVHRVGRTARLGRKGRALLILSDSEHSFIDVLHTHSISVQRLDTFKLMQTIDIPQHHGQQLPIEAVLMSHFCSLVDADVTLRSKAERAFTSYTRAYATYPKILKNVFHVSNLHLGHVASSFALRKSPMQICTTKQHTHPSRKQQHTRKRDDFKHNQRRKSALRTAQSYSEFAAA